MAWRLTLDVTKHGDIPYFESGFCGQKLVELHEHWFSHGEVGVQTILNDFERRLCFNMDHRERTFSERSLFSTVAFRYFELRNRTRIGSAILAGGGDNTDFSRVLLEHNLAIVGESQDSKGKSSRHERSGWLRRAFSRSPPVAAVPADILFESDQDWITCTSSSGRPLARYSACGAKCDSALIRHFARLLRFVYPAHPHILERIAAGSYLPRMIRIQSMELTKTPSDGFAIEILSVEKIPDKAYSVDGYRKITDPGWALPIDVAIERMMAQTIPRESDLVARRTTEFHTFTSAGKPLEAALSFLELIIETGSAPPQLVEAARTIPDARVKRVFTAMQPSNEEEAKVAIDALLELRAEATHGDHILMAFEAGARSILGQSLEAIELLTKAIEANPGLAGAYKDLGSEYARHYQFERAWRCWSVTRRLCPSHPQLEYVDELERTLLTQHPEFF